MKKILLVLLLVFTFTLTSCTKDELPKEEVSIKVMAPKGSPALAQVYMEHEMPSIGENANYEIEIVGGTDPLVAAFSSESHDIIYAPTNLAAKLVSLGKDYVFAGTVVWGTLYFGTSTEEEFTIDSLAGKEIIVFGQNATPDVVVQTALLDRFDSNAPTIRYVGAAADAQAEILANNEAIVLLTEPLLSVTKLKVPNLKIIDLQEEWKTVTGKDAYPQAGIFVKSELIEKRKDVVDNYLSEVEKSVKEANENTDAVAQMAVELEYGFPLPVLKSAIPLSSLRFVSAMDSKEDLEFYFSKILELNPALIGGELPKDNFYYN